MNNISTEHHKLVKVTHADLEDFLLKQSNKFWSVDGETFTDMNWPKTVDELIQAIELYGQGSEHVYIFNGNDEPWETANSVDCDNIPQVGLEELPNYVIRFVKGNDFLYFACSADEVSNGNPAVLLPWESQELDDEALEESEG